MSYEENAHLICHRAMLAALSLGLGSTIIGLIPPVVVNRSAFENATASQGQQGLHVASARLSEIQVPPEHPQGSRERHLSLRSRGVETHFEKQELSNPLRDPAIREAIRMLELPEGSNGLDAGCGIGSHTVLLAEAVGPGGHVTGLELFADFVTHATAQAKRSGLSDQVSFRQGNVNELPFDDASFDWAWSVDCVGQISIGRPLDGLRELAPGGETRRTGGSPRILLPDVAAGARGSSRPGSTQMRPRRPPPLRAGRQKPIFTRALGWFHAAGLEEPTARTVVGTVHAPLDDGVRRALISLFGMLWGEMQSRMTDEDRDEYLRLTEPDSPDFVLDESDYYAFFTYSMFEGWVAKKEVRNV